MIIYVDKFETFIKSVQSDYEDGGFDGCRYLKLIEAGDKPEAVYLVFGCTEAGLSCRIATRADGSLPDCYSDWDDVVAEEESVEDDDPYRLAYNVAVALRNHLESSDEKAFTSSGERIIIMM